MTVWIIFDLPPMEVRDDRPNIWVRSDSLQNVWRSCFLTSVSLLTTT